MTWRAWSIQKMHSDYEKQLLVAVVVVVVVVRVTAALMMVVADWQRARKAVAP